MSKSFETVLKVMVNHGLYLESIRTDTNSCTVKILDVPGHTKRDNLLEALHEITDGILKARRAQLAEYAEVSAAHPDTLVRFDAQIKRINASLKLLEGSDEPT